MERYSVKASELAKDPDEAATRDTESIDGMPSTVKSHGRKTAIPLKQNYITAELVCNPVTQLVIYLRASAADVDETALKVSCDHSHCEILQFNLFDGTHTLCCNHPTGMPTYLSHLDHTSCPPCKDKMERLFATYAQFNANGIATYVLRYRGSVPEYSVDDSTLDCPCKIDIHIDHERTKKVGKWHGVPVHSGCLIYCPTKSHTTKGGPCDGPFGPTHVRSEVIHQTATTGKPKERKCSQDINDVVNIVIL